MAARLPVDFDSCPVCRGVLSDEQLRGPAPRCPHCDTDLAPYLNLAARSDELLRLALEQVVRGDEGLAREVAARLPALVPDAGPLLHELRARLALSQRDYSAALAHAGKVGPLLQAEVEELAKAASRGQRTARELFNYALTCARRGEYAIAAESLARAVEHDPDSGDVWRLKLKADLKAGRWPQAYADLNNLDRLGARPAEFAGIEKLLPGR
jgi:tetratricopeptide (TPR) repeat protein